VSGLFTGGAGSTVVPFGDGTVARTGSAWNPYDGKSYRENKPRFGDGLIFNCAVRPKLFDTFTEPTSFMWYHPTQGTPNLIDRQATFETQYPEFDKVVLGSSYQGREIVGYRLGPITRKHWVVDMVVHGNEADGAQGTFRAMEILARDPIFQAFRDEWTIFFVPALNPDGWYLGTRNLAEIGPNGLTINLNRNWDWFWDEYAASSYESKGSAPESTLEAQAFLNYYRDPQVTFGFLLDQHADRGVGARYMSRDRIWRQLALAPGVAGEVPNNWRTLWLDWIIWRYVGHVTHIRARDAGGFDNYCRYYRSRFRPHLHSYFSSLGVMSMAMEDEKVSDAGGRETVASACNFRLDATLAAAICCTESLWINDYEEALLLESGPRAQLLSNANFRSWQDDEYRPGFYTMSRMTTARASEANSYNEDGGRATEMTSQTLIELSQAAEFNAGALTGYTSALIVTSQGQLFKIPTAVADESGDVIDPLSSFTSWMGAAAFAGDVDGTIQVFGGGSSEKDAAPTTQYYRLSDTTETSLVAVGAVPPGTQHAGFCDNFLDDPSLAAREGYLVGGWTGIAPTQAMYKVNVATLTWTLSAATLPTPTYGALAVYDPVRNYVWIIGGFNAAGTPQTSVGYWDIGADTYTPTAPLPLALGYVAGVYARFDGRIYAYGGQLSTGDMSPNIYRLNPASGAWTLLSVTANLDDDEDQQEPEDPVWTIQLGRAQALLPVETSTDNGVIYLLGGRQVSTSGALADDFYKHDLYDEIIGRVADADYGYIRYSTSVQTPWVEFVAALQPWVTAGAGTGTWTNAPANWSAAPAGLNPAGTKTGAAGNAALTHSETPPTYVSYRMRADVFLDGAGTIVSFRAVVRASYIGANIQDGYRVRNDNAGTTWTLERYNSTSGTTLATTTAAVIDTTPRELDVRVLGQDPVRLVVLFDGVELFNYTDASVNRLRTNGVSGYEGQSGTANLVVSDYYAEDTAAGEEMFTGSSLVQSKLATSTGYTRLSIQPGAQEVADAEYVTRRVRNYYTIPPSGFWFNYRVRAFLRHGPRAFVEDRIRYYTRVYKDSQVARIDGFMLAKGTLFGQSYLDTDAVSGPETCTFATAVQMNRLHASFSWLPTFGYPDVVDSDFELARFSIDVNNYLAIILVAGNDEEREFNRDDLYAQHDPVIRLSKVQAGSEVDYVDIVCYYGYAMREPGCERVDDPVRFTIVHVEDQLFRFSVERFGFVVHRESTTDLTGYSTTAGTLSYTGHGLYGKPTISYDGMHANGMHAPLGRHAIDQRLRDRDSVGVFVAGERDPTQGGISTYNKIRPFIDGDDFTRPDDANLGYGWDIIKQTGNGFNIVSSKAQCAELGFESREGDPRHADYIAAADLTVQNNNDIVGILARIDRFMSETVPGDEPFGYGFELIQTGPTAATLRIVTYWNGVREILATQALSSYTAGETLRLVVTTSGTSLRGEISGRAIVTTTDTLFKRPGRPGIMGETGGPAQFVTVDNWTLTENFESSTV